MKKLNICRLFSVLFILGAYPTTSVRAAEESSVDSLSDMSCKLCNDTEFKDDLEKLRKKYGKEISAAAAKQKLTLSEDDLNKVLTKIKNSQYDEVCQISFSKSRVIFQSADSGKLGVTKETFEKNANDEQRGPYLNRQPFTSARGKAESAEEQVEFPALMNSFADCETKKFSEKGERDYGALLNKFETFLKEGGKISHIDLHCSTSTLRNTCGTNKSVETISHLELGTNRCQYVQNRLNADVNALIEKQNSGSKTKIPSLSDKDFQLDTGGESGDGTSGPLPPDTYGCSNNVYGNGKEPHTAAADYDQYKYAKISVTGIVPKAAGADAVSGETFYMPHFQNCNPIRPKAFSGPEYHGQCPMHRSSGSGSSARTISRKKAKQQAAERIEAAKDKADKAKESNSSSESN